MILFYFKCDHFFLNNCSYCLLLTQNSGQIKISRDRPIWQTFMVMLSIKWLDEQRGKRRAADSNTEKDIWDILWFERREKHDEKGELGLIKS